VKVELVSGHIYSDGKYTYQAIKPEDDLLLFALYRVNIHNRTLVYPIIADSLVGYVQVDSGHWHQLVVGNLKYSNQRMFLRPCPEFASEVFPTLQHEADSFNDYLNLKGL
jgi:hypothetical protein